MYDKRAERDAQRWGILDRMQALENDLMQVKGIVNVEFDICGYGDPAYGNVRHVILIPKYDIDVELEPEAYFKARREQREAIYSVCEKHGLFDTGDRVEDMGAHWYIVRGCDKSWPR